MTVPITAGVDGTDESLAALAWAAREAVRRDLELRVVHAWRFQPNAAADVADRDDQERWVRDSVREAVATVAERHPALSVTTDVQEGSPVETLVAAAADAELLVLGSRGHGPVVGFLLGSVGQQVIAEAARPVVLVRAGDKPSSEVAGHEIVVGQQGEPEDSAPALRFAFETAAARGAGVRAVRAWTLPPVFAYSPGSLKLADDAAWSGAVREEGAVRGPGTVAGAVPRRAGGGARGDGQRRAGAAVGVRAGAADGGRPPRPPHGRGRPDRLGGARRPAPRGLPGRRRAPRLSHSDRLTPGSSAPGSPVPWAGSS